MPRRLHRRTRRPDTREALLDAAETLFAEYGVQQASLRAITRAAGANLASVHYHFGSKRQLIREVFARRLRPLNEERLTALERCLAGSGDTSPAVRDLVEAFVAPAIRRAGTETWGPQFGRLVIRALAEPGKELRDLLLEEFKEVRERFGEAFIRSLPQVPLPEIHWRLHFVVGAMAYAVGMGSVARAVSAGLCDPTDVETLTRHLVGFLTAGLESPAAGAAESRP